MGRVILNRILGSIPVILIVTLITFGLMRAIPGDVSAALGGTRLVVEPRADAAQGAAARRFDHHDVGAEVG